MSPCDGVVQPFLGYVQPVGDQPRPALADETADFGVGAFLLAGAEVFGLTSATL
ncbi:hypothetical protein ACQPW3_27970 [Actinosynnema sp. CA-248983]